jgi:threonine synthase
MSADTPEERSYPVFALGTSVIKVTAPIDEVMEALIQAGTRLGIYLASTTRRSNPYQAEASKTIAYELVEALGEPPDWLVVPTGGGGTVAAVWRGFQELHGLGLVSKLPQLAAIVPRRFNALEVAFRDGIATAADYLALPTRPGASTLLTKLAHDHPPDGLEAIEAVRQSGGLVLSVTDAAASAGQMRLAQHEGLYVEPSSGVLLPALDELFAAGHAAPGQRIVGLLCGSGFRETFEVMKQIPMRSKTVDLDDLENALAET